jgi:GNAT superfamily N-acetyltransferase
MVASEALARIRLKPTDIASGLALSDAAGWNQTADDWALFIEHGHVIGFRSERGELVATAAALPYAGELGWISMVLVAPEWRKRGLATLLMDDCVKSLQGAQLVPVLDATPDGAQVYSRIGFKPGFALARWESAAARARTADESFAGLRSASLEDLDAIADLDECATGIGRRFILRAFLARTETGAWMTSDAGGFVIARQGHRAWQIGPLVAPDEQTGIALLGTALSNCPGRVFLDVPERWTAVMQWLERRGFARQRSFVRMALGPASTVQLSDRVFVLAGPEFG